MSIHPTAVVDPRAEIDQSVSIGPYAVVEADVTIGKDTIVDAHAVICSHTTIGERNHFGSFSSIGAAPQDIHYQGEPTQLIIGNDNRIREYVSIHRGTVSGNGKTYIGNNNMLMAYTHIAHDCKIHNNIIMANVATLAGHVEVEDYVNLGGMVGLHQFCRIGTNSYVGGLSGISKDVPPYVILTGTRSQSRIVGINKIGLSRNGMSRDRINCLSKAFKIIFKAPPEKLLQDALKEAEETFPDSQEVRYLVEFFRNSKRGVTTRTD